MTRGQVHCFSGSPEICEGCPLGGSEFAGERLKTIDIVGDDLYGPGAINHERMAIEELLASSNIGEVEVECARRRFENSRVVGSTAVGL